MDETVLQILGNVRADTISVEDFESTIYCKVCDVFYYSVVTSAIQILQQFTDDIPVLTRDECESSSN